MIYGSTSSLLFDQQQVTSAPLASLDGDLHHHTISAHRSRKFAKSLSGRFNVAGVSGSFDKHTKTLSAHKKIRKYDNTINTNEQYIKHINTIQVETSKLKEIDEKLSEIQRLKNVKKQREIDRNIKLHRYKSVTIIQYYWRRYKHMYNTQQCAMIIDFLKSISIRYELSQLAKHSRVLQRFASYVSLRYIAWKEQEQLKHIEKMAIKSTSRSFTDEALLSGVNTITESICATMKRKQRQKQQQASSAKETGSPKSKRNYGKTNHSHGNGKSSTTINSSTSSGNNSSVMSVDYSDSVSSIKYSTGSGSTNKQMNKIDESQDTSLIKTAAAAVAVAGKSNASSVSASSVKSMTSLANSRSSTTNRHANSSNTTSPTAPTHTNPIKVSAYISKPKSNGRSSERIPILPNSATGSMDASTLNSSNNKSATAFPANTTTATTTATTTTSTTAAIDSSQYSAYSSSHQAKPLLFSPIKVTLSPHATTATTHKRMQDRSISSDKIVFPYLSAAVVEKVAAKPSAVVMQHHQHVSANKSSKTSTALVAPTTMTSGSTYNAALSSNKRFVSASIADTTAVLPIVIAESLTTTDTYRSSLELLQESIAKTKQKQLQEKIKLLIEQENKSIKAAKKKEYLAKMMFIQIASARIAASVREERVKVMQKKECEGRMELQEQRLMRKNDQLFVDSVIKTRLQIHRYNSKVGRAIHSTSITDDASADRSGSINDDIVSNNESDIAHANTEDSFHETNVQQLMKEDLIEQSRVAAKARIQEKQEKDLLLKREIEATALAHKEAQDRVRLVALDVVKRNLLRKQKRDKASSSMLSVGDSDNNSDSDDDFDASVDEIDDKKTSNKEILFPFDEFLESASIESIPISVSRSVGHHAIKIYNTKRDVKVPIPKGLKGTPYYNDYLTVVNNSNDSNASLPYGNDSSDSIQQLYERAIKYHLAKK